MGYSLDQNTSSTTSPTYTHVRRVAVIGAGVAGLQLAERLRKKDGLTVTIFEKTNKVGGVWAANYADFGLQVPKELYEFPAFPYPKDMEVERFPRGPQVQKYIEAFAEHFSLNEHVKFGTSVSSLQKLERGWLVTHSRAGSDDDATTEHFDFVVVATGMYGGASPHLPAADGMEGFDGEVLHSFHFREREQARGKRVVVVGGGKSAVDCAVAAVKGGAEEVTLLFREGHWPVPRYILDLIPFQFATYSRFGHALLPTHHDVSPLVWWLHALLTPLKWLVWRLVELIFRLQFRIPREMLPSSRIEIDVFTGGQILTYEARDMIAAGTLRIRKGAIERYVASGVELRRTGATTREDAASLACDLVVYGTGFTKSYGYLDAALQARLGVQKDGLYLYRSMLPLDVPDLAFLGSEVSTFNNVLTHGLQAAWLAKLLSGDVVLPAVRAMRQEVEKEMNWKRTWMPSTSARAAIQQLHMPKYHDKLVEDMGYGACRKSNPLFEALLPYNARDYASIFGLPDRTTWMRLKALALLTALLLGPLVAAVVGVGLYLLPEEVPRCVRPKNQRGERRGDARGYKLKEDPTQCGDSSPHRLHAEGAGARQRMLISARAAAGA